MVYISSNASAKCFSYEVTKLAMINEAVLGIVKDSASDKVGRCELTLEINNVLLTGAAKDDHCKAKLGDLIKVNINTYCCDTEACDKTQKDRIWFTK